MAREREAYLVYMRAKERNPLASPDRSKFPQSQFNGESGSGWASKEMILLQTDCSVKLNEREEREDAW
jgi:hypothetical protein